MWEISSLKVLSSLRIYCFQQSLGELYRVCLTKVQLLCDCYQSEEQMATLSALFPIMDYTTSWPL